LSEQTKAGKASVAHDVMNAFEALRAAAAGAPAAKTDSTKSSAADKPHEILAELKAVLHAGHRHHRNVTPWFGFPGLKQGYFLPLAWFAIGGSESLAMTAIRPSHLLWSRITRPSLLHMMTP
jgi:hypothetical protein